MIDLKIAYNNKNITLVESLNSIINNYPLIRIEAYNEDLYKEKKKAFKLKGGFSAKQSPFAVISNSEKKIIQVFYSESKECTLDNIIKTLDTIA